MEERCKVGQRKQNATIRIKPSILACKITLAKTFDRLMRYRTLKENGVKNDVKLVFKSIKLFKKKYDVSDCNQMLVCGQALQFAWRPSD